ncbi:hypothetical protein CKO15_03475 [Halorhodospira abdelmalekii]|nr:hypothetical protein [Halorhodospira abdelmalekii]
MNVEDAADPNITGLAAERALLRQGNFTAASGVMIGNDGNNDMAADIYGRFTLAATDHTNMYARLAYRTLPQSTAADNLNGIALSIGFGINF